MKKKELLQLQEMKPTKLMIQAMTEDKGYMAERYQAPSIWAPNYIWFFRVKKTKDVLEIDLFTREMLERRADYPRYRVFLHDGKYDTFDNTTEKWRTATIEKLEYANYEYMPKYYYYSNRGIWIAEKEREILQKYVKNGIGDPMAAVQQWEDYKKNRSELDKIDAEMRLVPEIPKDFGEWIKTDGLPQYIFYDAGRNVKEGYCTACKHTVQIYKPRYNRETICPHCKRKVTYKSRKKAGHMVDWGYVGLLQRTREGFIYRYFEVKQKYVNGIRTEGGYWEMVRQTYDQEFRERNEFEFGRYKQTGMVRWCYKYYGWKERVVENEVILYWRNLKQITKGTPMQYAAIEIFAKQKQKFFPENYIRVYRKEKGLEQLVKCGFYSIVKRVISPYGINTHLELNEKSTPKILGLEKRYYKILQGTDPTVREYEITKEFQEFGIFPKRETIAYLAEYSYGRNFAVYIRHTTEHKMMRYLKEHLESDREQIRDYHDYLQMAAGLGYSLEDEYILYPKNLKQRHEQYVEERNERDQKIQRMEDDQKLEEYQKTIEQRKWKWYEMESGELLLRLPESPAEIRKEGNQQHHCVSTYIDRMVEGKTCIVFIRQKETPEESFYTMEVKDGMVVQVRGKYNKNPTEEVKEFVEEFKRKKLRIQERMAG